MNEYTVGETARLAGISVRTLHHYDEAGLLQPSGRNAAGYRLYSPQDLQRLQRVLFYRELGFGLDTIAVIVDDPWTTGGDHLRRQRQLLSARIARCQAMVAVIDKELSVRKLGISLTPQERLEVFGSAPLEDLADGVGADAEWAQQPRMSAYTVRDWQMLADSASSCCQSCMVYPDVRCCCGHSAVPPKPRSASSTRSSRGVLPKTSSRS